MNKNDLLELKASVQATLKLIDGLLEASSMAQGRPRPQETPGGPRRNSNEQKTPQKASRKAFAELPVSLDDPDWPAAVPDSSIVRNDSQKWARANTILTKFEPVLGPILDFGCGEGHTTIVLHDIGHNVIGYDIAANDMWHKISTSDSIFTDSWESIEFRGPYRSVLLHDVLDHIENETIDEVLDKIADVLEDNGRLYVMAHPFSSRHGGHLYEWSNKAFLHLVLNADEIAEKYPEAIFNQGIVKPQGQYQKHLNNRFTIINKKVVPQNVEPWVIENLLPAIKERHFPNLDKNQVEKVLQTSGIYYTAKKSPDLV